MNIDYNYLRSRKAAFLKGQYDLFDKNDIAVRWAEVDNGVVIPPESDQVWNSYVLQPDGKPAPFSVEDIDPEGIPPLTIEPVKSEATALFGGYFNLHWGHFLLEVLPQIWPIFQDSMLNVDKIVFTACRQIALSDVVPNIREAFALLGLENKIEIIASPCRYKRVIVPQKPILPRGRAARECLAVYDAIVAAAEKRSGGVFDFKSRKGVYLSRRHFAKSILNEPGSEWLDRYFEQNGFEIVCPERMSLVETIATIRRCDVVAAMSGTLPHNMVFSRPGQKLWIIEKTPIVNNYQQGIDRLRQLDVVAVDANALVWTTSAGLGPFIVFPNAIFRKFAADNGLSIPEPWSDSRKRRVLAKFISVFHRHYGRQWVMAPWEEPEIESLREAWRDTMTEFGPFIKGERPVTLSDMFSLRGMAKRLYKFIRRLRR